MKNLFKILVVLSMVFFIALIGCKKSETSESADSIEETEAVVEESDEEDSLSVDEVIEEDGVDEDSEEENQDVHREDEDTEDDSIDMPQ